MATTLRRKYSHNVGTSATQVGSYSAPSVTTGVFLTGLVVCNVTSSNITVTIDIYDGTNHVALCSGATVTGNGSITLADSGHRIVLNSGDQVFATSSAATSIDVTMSLEEIQ